MADKTEYIFEKDFLGNWKLVPKKDDNSNAWLILLLVILLMLCIAITTLPFWIALLGFKMVKKKRYYAGIGSLLTLLYFIIDIKNRWITGFLFLGYYESSGQFIEGLISEKIIIYVYVINAIGVMLGLFFILQSYLLNKENNISNNLLTDDKKTSINSITADEISFSTYESKTSSGQLNSILIILGIIFTITVLYFTFNKNSNNQFVRDKEEVRDNQSVNSGSSSNVTIKDSIVEKDYHNAINQDDLLNFVSQYYNDLNNRSFLAENFFSDNVIQYINRKNLSPEEINSLYRDNNEFVNSKTIIINNKIYFDRTDADVKYYNYWVDFRCFRKSKNKYQSCKVNIEIGIDGNRKIVSYRELEVTDLKFTAIGDSEKSVTDILNGYYSELNNDNYDQLLNYYSDYVEKFIDQSSPISKYEIVQGHKNYHQKYPYHIYELKSIKKIDNNDNENKFFVEINISIKKNEFDEYRTYKVQDIFTFDSSLKILKVELIK